jgi:hypothetical protein
VGLTIFGAAWALAIGAGLAGLRPDRVVAPIWPSPGPTHVAAATSNPAPSPPGQLRRDELVQRSPSPDPSPSPTPPPSPTPQPTPTPVPAPLTGRLVTPDAAARHPIAVMIDDLGPARPQSGFSAASVVWHAPAEGGIPRYMLVFAELEPGPVGPVRSARQYYVEWAAEWRAVYAHVGGSPQALATLRSEGRGGLVYDADQFRWGRSHFWRIPERFSPHNVYTDGEHLRALAKILKVVDEPMEPAWTFAPAAPYVKRPEGGRIEVDYRANRVRYDYDRRTNTYLRSVSAEGEQVDAATGERVAPTNVVVMLVHFGPLKDGSKKHRLEADLIGKGPAWVATNGRTAKGTWRKDSVTDPTRFLDGKGRPIPLSVGQTFIQVLPYGTPMTIEDGAVPFSPATLRGPTFEL